MKIKDYIIIILLLIAGNFYSTKQVLQVVNSHKAAIISQDSTIDAHSTLLPQLIQAANSQIISNEVVSRTLLAISPEELKAAQQATQKRLEEEAKKTVTPAQTPSNDSK